MTEVVILAAGIGSRLAPITDNQPKCMTELGGEALISRIVRQLLSFEKVNQIHIVVGHYGEQISTLFEGVDRVSTLTNEAYLTTNNLYSLSLALRGIAGQGDLIVVNGDCAYDDEIIERIVTSSASHSEVCADSSVFIEESMKVRTDDDGFINDISKVITEQNADATSIDLYRFTSSDKQVLIELALEILGDGGLNSWTEVALAKGFNSKQLKARPLDISGYRWIEVDNLQDLEAGQKLFAIATEAL